MVIDPACQGQTSMPVLVQEITQTLVSQFDGFLVSRDNALG